MTIKIKKNSKKLQLVRTIMFSEINTQMNERAVGPHECKHEKQYFSVTHAFIQKVTFNVILGS